MTDHKDAGKVPIERWRLWLGRLLLIPLAAMTGGLIFGLYRAAVTGEISAVSKGYIVSSRVYNFAESPVGFLLIFSLVLALTGLVIFVTVLVVRLVITKPRLPTGPRS